MPHPTPSSAPVSGREGPGDARRGWSLRARLTALLAATLLPLLGVGAYWIVLEAGHERVRVEREGLEIAARIAAQAGSRVGTVQQMLTAFARIPAVRRQDRAEIEQILRRILTDSPYLENIGTFTADGALVASAFPATERTPASFGDRPWLQAVLGSGKPVVSGFQVGRITGKPVVVVAAPILEREGKLLGILTATLRLSAVSGEVAPMQPGAQGRWAVVDDRGLVLLSGAHNPAIGEPLGALPGMFRAEAAVPRTPWRAVVAVPRAAIAGRARAGLVRVGLPALLILLAAAAAGLWIASGAWRSLRDLAAAVRALGAGELSRRVPPIGLREVDELAAALNEMAARRQQAEADLQRSLRRRAVHNHLSAAIAVGTDRAGIMREVVVATAQLLGTPYAVLWTVDREAGRLVAAAEYADPVLGIPPQPPIPLATTFAGSILRDGRAQAVPDVRGDPRWGSRTWPGLGHLGAYAGAPLEKEGTPLGVLATLDRPGREFSGEDMELLRSLGTHAALAIDKAALLEDARQAAARAQALFEAARLLSTSPDPDQVLDLIVDKALAVSGAQGCGIARSLPGDALQVVRFKGINLDIAPGSTFARGEGTIGRCLEKQGPVWRRDISEDDAPSEAGTKGRAVAAGLRAALAVPIPTPEGLYGVLFIGRDRPHDHTPEEIAFAEALAAQAGTAIENDHLFQQEQGRRRQVEAARAVAEEITRELDLSTLLGLIHRRAAELVGAAAGTILLWDEAAQRLLPRAWHGYGDWMRELRYGLGEGFSGVIAQRREGMILNDYRTSPLANPALLERTPITAALGEPLLYRDRLLGVITLNDESGRTFTETDREILALFARQAAIAIENARLYEQAREALRQLEALYEAGQAVVETLDLGATLQRIAENARRLARADRAFVWVVDSRDGSLEAGTAVGAGAEAFLGTRLPGGSRAAAALAASQGRIVVVENTAASTDADRSLGARFGNAAVIALPLRIQATMLGVLVCAHAEPRAFAADTIRELRALAGHAAIALENARLYAEAGWRQKEAEEALARVKQLQGLLPICAYCKKIRDDKNYWQQVETYVARHSGAQFSHSICPDCYEKVVKPQLKGLLGRRNA